MAVVNMTVLCLSPRGDSLKLCELDFWNNLTQVTVEKLEANLSRDQITKLETATKSKTHAAVLEFLEFAQSDPTIMPFLRLIHLNHPNYMDHTAKRYYHFEKIGKMINYVKERIARDKTPHRIFDKIGRGLGSTYSVLRKWTPIPILGSLPAAARALLGAIQMTCGLALSILSAIPAYFSENAKIVFQRSTKHIGYGFLNMTIGTLEIIPGVGLFTQHTCPPPANYGLK